jgi:hypothetical protein
MEWVERTQISLTEDQARRLRTLARRRGMSLAALIRDAVDRAYPQAGRADEQRTSAPAPVGGSRPSAPGVSSAHDRRLGDASDG